MLILIILLVLIFGGGGGYYGHGRWGPGGGAGIGPHRRSCVHGGLAMLMTFHGHHSPVKSVLQQPAARIAAKTQVLDRDGLRSAGLDREVPITGLRSVNTCL